MAKDPQKTQAPKKPECPKFFADFLDRLPGVPIVLYPGKPKPNMAGIEDDDRTSPDDTDDEDDDVYIENFPEEEKSDDEEEEDTCGFSPSW